MGLSSNELAARIALLKKDRAMSTEMMEEKCASSREKALNLFKRLGKNKEFVIVGKPGTGAGERLTKKAFWQGFEKRAQHNKEAVLLAGGVHVLQNAFMRNKIRSPKFAKTVASEFQQGLANKAPSKMKQFFRSMVGGATVPEASMVREHVRHLGDEARKNLVEHGVKSLGKKEMLLARVVSKGDFHKLLDDRYFNKNNPAHQAILKTVEGRIGAKITPENAEALSKAWKSKDSPITSNLLSGITRGPGQSVGGRLHIPQHTGSTVSHGASLAGHVAGGAVTGLVDPLTGAMNASKSILTNPISRGWLSKIKGGAKALAGSDKMFMSDPIAKGKAMGLAGKEIPKAEKLVRGYGLNAATSEMQNTANSLSLAAHGAKNPSSMAAAPASPIVRRPLPLVQPHMGLTPMGLGGFNGV